MENISDSLLLASTRRKMEASGQDIKLCDETNTFNPHFLADLKRLGVRDVRNNVGDAD